MPSNNRNEVDMMQPNYADEPESTADKNGGILQFIFFEKPFEHLFFSNKTMEALFFCSVLCGTSFLDL